MGKEEEKEKKPPLLKLIQESGDLLGSRYIVELVEAARSPKAVDDHFVKLGWSNDTAYKARNAARIFQHYPKEWELFKDNDVDQVEYHFRGDEKIPLAMPVTHTLLCHDHFAIGEESADISGWPEFLRAPHWNVTGYSQDVCFGNGKNFANHIVGLLPHYNIFNENNEPKKTNLRDTFVLELRQMRGFIVAKTENTGKKIYLYTANHCLTIDSCFYQQSRLINTSSPKLYSTGLVDRSDDGIRESVCVSLGYDHKNYKAPSPDPLFSDYEKNKSMFFDSKKPALPPSCGTLTLLVVNNCFNPITVKMKMEFGLHYDESKKLCIYTHLFHNLCIYIDSKKLGDGPVNPPGLTEVISNLGKKQNAIERFFRRPSLPNRINHSRNILSKLFGLESLNYRGSLLDLFLN